MKPWDSTVHNCSGAQVDGIVMVYIATCLRDGRLSDCSSCENVKTAAQVLDRRLRLSLSGIHHTLSKTARSLCKHRKALRKALLLSLVESKTDESGP